MIKINPTPISLLANRLRELQLEHWLAPLVDWLSNYDGMEKVTDDDAPAQQVLSVLDLLHTGADDQLVAKTLTTKPDFLYYRVRYSNISDQLWNPFEEPLYQFITRRNADPANKGYHMPVWDWVNTYPSEELITQHLLEKLAFYRSQCLVTG